MTSPGTLAIVANRTDWSTVAPDGCQVIVDLSSLAVAVPPPDRLFALYGTTNTNTLAESVTAAVKLKTRVLDVLDGPGLYPEDRLRQLRPWDLPSLELYRRPGQTLIVASERWDIAFSDLLARWPEQIGGVVQTYRMNGLWTVAEVWAIAAAGVEAINRAGPRVTVAPCFAWGRQDAVPAVASAVCAASPGRPVLIPIPNGATLILPAAARVFLRGRP